MPLNCQPHDIAVSINADNPENNGIIVRVLRRHINTADWNFGSTPAWWCVSSQLMTWTYTKSDRVVRAYEGPIPDRSLKPIRPGKPEQSRHTEQIRSLELELA